MPTLNTGDLLLTYIDGRGRIHSYKLEVSDVISSDLQSPLPDSVDKKMPVIPSPLNREDHKGLTPINRRSGYDELQGAQDVIYNRFYASDAPQLRNKINSMYDVSIFEYLGSAVISSSQFTYQVPDIYPTVKMSYWNIEPFTSSWERRPSGDGHGNSVRTFITNIDGTDKYIQDVDVENSEGSSTSSSYANGFDEPATSTNTTYYPEAIYTYNVKENITATLGTSVTVTTDFDGPYFIFTVSDATDLNSLADGYMTLKFDFTVGGESLLSSSNNTMRFLNPTITDTSYTVKLRFNNSDYESRTGNSFEDDDRRLTGNLVVSIYDDNDQKLISNYLAVDHQVSSASSAPEWKDAPTGTTLSGYWYGETLYGVPQESQPPYPINREIIYIDETGEEKSIGNLPSANNFALVLNRTHPQLVGKICKIRETWESMDSNVILESSPVVPTLTNYYDIDEVTVTISGVAAGAGYTRTGIQENDGTFNVNTINDVFYTSAGVDFQVAFTVNSNTSNLDNVSTPMVPYPKTIWLFAVPNNPISSNRGFHEGLFLGPHLGFLGERRDSRSVTFPSVDHEKASQVLSYFSSTPSYPSSTIISEVVATKKDVTTYTIPEDGTFTTADYYIDISTPKGQWALFLIIESITGESSMYCITNPRKFDVPKEGGPPWA